MSIIIVSEIDEYNNENVFRGTDITVKTGARFLEAILEMARNIILVNKLKIGNLL